MYNNSAKLQDNAETSNHGKKWNIEDDLKLIKYMEENKSYEDIAIDFKRTIGSIKSRVLDKIIFLEYNDDNVEELAKKYCYDVEYLKKCLEYKKKICDEKLNPKEEKVKNKKVINEDLLEQIMYRLVVIEKRLELLEK
jgi:Mor family transcriptional regulator